MYICLCNAVNEQDIQMEVCKGATNLKQISQKLGVAMGCGQCAQDAMECIQKCKNRRPLQNSNHRVEND